MDSFDLWHALISGVIIAAILWCVDHLGWLEGKSKRQRAMVIGPIVFVVMLALNTIWPVGM